METGTPYMLYKDLGLGFRVWVQDFGDHWAKLKRKLEATAYHSGLSLAPSI